MHGNTARCEGTMPARNLKDSGRGRRREGTVGQKRCPNAIKDATGDNSKPILLSETKPSPHIYGQLDAERATIVQGVGGGEVGCRRIQLKLP